MSRSVVIRRLGWMTLALWMLGTVPAFAAEILDNPKINKAVKKGVSLEVILQMITAAGSQCRFDSSNDAIIEIQDSGKEGGWKQEDIKTLQKKIIEVAGADKKRLETLVNVAMNVFENGDPQEYEDHMQKIVDEGKKCVAFLMDDRHKHAESERKRAGVMDALRRVGDKSEEVVRVAGIMVFDRSKPVRLQASKCIAALAGPNTCVDLIDKMNNRTEKLDGLAMALGYLGDERAVEPLTKLLKLSNDSDARVCAAWAVGELRAKLPAAVDALLVAVLEERDEKLRDSAAVALAQIKDRRAPSYIMTAFRRFRGGREDMLKHLAYFKDAEAINFLLEQLDSDVPTIKKASYETLFTITGERYDSSEEWRGWWEANKFRPDWIGTKGSEQKLPEPRGEGRSALPQKREGDGIPTSAP